MRDLGEARPRRFARRWTDAEIAALWQSMAFKVEYRCFNCVATCPAEIHDAFHADTAVRRDYLRNTLQPLTHTRREVDEQFVIDTPAAREALGIPPGEWRTPPDETRPTARGTRLVQLHRIRTSNVDSMMRNLPHYFRPEEAAGLAFTCQLELTGAGGGDWVMTVGDRRCQVRPGRAERPDLVVRCDARLFLRVHRGEARAPWQLLLGRIRLRGRRRLFLVFPRLFAIPPGESWLHRLGWRARRWRRRRAGRR